MIRPPTPLFLDGGTCRRRHPSIAWAIAASIIVSTAPVTSAQVCPPQCPAPGGKSKRTDCYAEFSEVPEAVKRVNSYCTDGDPSCDVGTTEDQCDILVGVCLNNNDPRFHKCEPSGVPSGGITIESKRGDPEQIEALRDAVNAILPAGATTNACSAHVTISVPVTKNPNGGPKEDSVTIKLKATSETGKKDGDKLVLYCVTPPAPPGNCPVNPAGGPNRLTFTVSSGADLDAGWTGISHNFEFARGSNVFVCLEGCDIDSNPVCTGTGQTDTGGSSGTINGRTFGPPLAVGGDVPVCIVNEYRQDVVLDAFDLGTGEASLELYLAERVHASGSSVQPCPICKAPSAVGARGRCVGGPNDGKRCVVEGISPYGNLSGTCHPDAADTLDELLVNIDLTTGSATLLAQAECQTGGNCPCTGQQKANNCDTACSTDQCPTGLQTGVDQLCCTKGGAKRGCFTGDITRTGLAVSPTPAWGDSSYPKIGNGERLVATFCVPPSTSGILTVVTGLGGPGALILPGSIVVDRSVCSGGSNDGSPCTADDDCPEGACE